MGLTYRGGRGNFLTEAFHPRCAALEQPALAAAFLADESASKRAPIAHVDEVRAALGPDQRDAAARDAEYAWHNSGGLYDLELASQGQTCMLSGRAIAPGELHFVRPRIDFGKSFRDPFRLDAGLGTRDFDWANFEDRLALSVQKHGHAEQYREELVRAAASTPRDAERLRAAAAGVAAGPPGRPAAAGSRSSTPASSSGRVAIFGLDRKGGRKQDLRWDLFFAGKVSPKLRAAAQREPPASRATWEHGRILTLHYGDPTGKTTLNTFRDALAQRLDELHALVPLHAAHFCLAGDVRASRAAVLEDLGKAPYPFPFVNHGRSSPHGAGWALLVRFPRALKGDARRHVEEALAEHSLQVAWATQEAGGCWARARHVHDGAYGPWLEAKLDPVLESAGVSAVLLRAAELEGEGDGWHRWSERQPGRPVDADVAALEFAQAEPDDAEIAKLVADARALYESDDAMDDPGSDVDAFERILVRIPKRRREHREVKKMLDEMLAMLAR